MLKLFSKAARTDSEEFERRAVTHRSEADRHSTGHNTEVIFQVNSWISL